MARDISNLILNGFGIPIYDNCKSHVVLMGYQFFIFMEQVFTSDFEDGKWIRIMTDNMI